MEGDSRRDAERNGMQRMRNTDDRREEKVAISERPIEGSRRNEVPVKKKNGSKIEPSFWGGYTTPFERSEKSFSKKLPKFSKKLFFRQKNLKFYQNYQGQLSL